MTARQECTCHTIDEKFYPHGQDCPLAVTAPQGRGLREEIGSAVLIALLHLRTDKGPFSGEAAEEIADAVLAVLTRRGDDTGRVDALRLIDRDGCENVHGERRCWDVGKTRGTRYGADAWCAPGSARRALDGGRDGQDTEGGCDGGQG